MNNRAAVADHCAKRVCRAVKAHCAVENKTLVDNVLKAARDLVVKRHAHFIDTVLIASPRITEEVCQRQSVRVP